MSCANCNIAYNEAGGNMKYDLLDAYKIYLAQFYQPSTVETYYKNLANLFVGNTIFFPFQEIDVDATIHNLSKITYKNHFSQAKNALLHFLEFKNIPLSEEQKHRIDELEHQTKKKYRKKREIDACHIEKSIKYMKNKKLKLCFQMMLYTGLRVCELSSIRKEDVFLFLDKINFIFRAKGGKWETISLFETGKETFYRDILALVETTNEGKRVFYSPNYLQSKAKELGFTCHDLRRIYAKEAYAKTKSIAEVQKNLRHTSAKTTKIYLKSNIKR